MYQTIIDLYNQGKYSEEISKILCIDKLKIDIILLENFYKNNSNPKRLDINLIKLGILNKNRNPTLSNIKIGKRYGFSHVTFGRILKQAGISFRNAHYKDKSVLTDNNKAIITKKFNSGNTINSIALQFNLNHSIVSNTLKGLGINTMPSTFDEHSFDVIDTEEKAYWLGFLYADGNVSNTKNEVGITLQSSDIKHLYKFKTFLKSSKIPTLNVSEKYNRCRFSVSNQHFKESLIKHGCFPQKSLILKKPSLDCVYIKDFIRGYFDGDGCLTYSYTNPYKSEKITISCKIVGTFDFLTWIKSVLEKELIIGNISKCKNKKLFEISFSKKNSLSFVNYIYNNCNVYLDRKYKRFLFFFKT